MKAYGLPSAAPAGGGSLIGAIAGRAGANQPFYAAAPKQLQSFADFKAGGNYVGATTGSAAETAWNQKSANTNAMRDYLNSAGVPKMVTNFMGNTSAKAKENFMLKAGLYGTYRDPTFGGATGKIDSLLAGAGGMFGLDATQNNEMRSRQVANLGLLEAAANGTGGPSAAELQLKKSADTNAAAGYSQAASMRGMGNPAAMRMAAYQAAGARQDAAGQAAVLRAQEQAQARQLYTSAMEGVRGQDQNWAQLGLSAQQARASYTTSLLGLQQGYAGMNQQDELARLGMLTQYKTAQDQLAAAQKKGGGKNLAKIIGGGLMAAAGTVGAFFTGGATAPVAAAGVNMAVDGFRG